MHKLPLVSVVITTYGHENYIGRAVESALRQDVDEMEIIVLDDCSPDRTPSVIEPYLCDKRVKYIRHASNIGDKANNTLALQTGHGKYLAWLHGDDYFLPGHISAYLDVMETNPNCALAYSPCYWIDEHDRIIKIARHPGHPDFSYTGGRNETAELLVWDNYITPSSVMFRRSILDELAERGPLINTTDWDLFVRIARFNSDFVFVDRPTTGYRIHSAQYSQAFYASIEPLRAHIAVLEETLETPASTSLWEHGEKIAEHLERRIKRYKPEDYRSLMPRIEAVFDKLCRLSPPPGSGERDGVPLVSVIVPTKDRPELLQDALASIRAQTYENWEAVIVNDGGIDVEAMVRELNTDCNRLRYVRHETSKGLPSARNTGIRFSRGEVLCYLDDDDTFCPNHLTTVVEALEGHDADFVYTEAEYIQESVENGCRTEVGRSTPYSGLKYSRDRLLVTNFIPVNTWAHRRRLLKLSGLFDPGLRAFEDWDLLIRFSQHTDFVAIPQLTVEVHMRVGSAGDHMTQRERKNYPALYRELYERYGCDGNEQIERQRARQLEALDAGSESAASDAFVGYEKWVDNHAVSESKLRGFLEKMEKHWRIRPAIHFVVTHVRGQEEALADTLDSLAAQVYGGWGLSVVSHDPCPDETFDALDMIEWRQVEGDLMAAVNLVMSESTAQWMGLIEPGVLLEQHFLFSCVDALQLNRDWRLIYCDEDRIGADGSRYDVQFKPDFNLELLRARPYPGDFVLIEREALLRSGGYLEEQVAASYDAVFRLVEQHGSSAVGHVSEVLVHRQDRFTLAADSRAVAEIRRQCVVRHFHRIGVGALVEHGSVADSYFVDYESGSLPPVDVLVPVTGMTASLDLFLDRLFSKTEYPEFRVTLLADEDIGLDEMQMATLGVEVWTYSRKQGLWSAVLDRARHAETELILLISPGALVVQPNWLKRLAVHMKEQNVAVVGPRLVSAEGRVVDGAVVLGAGTSAVGAIAHSGLEIDDAGYMGRAQVAQEMSAVSINCMLLRRSVFDELNGIAADKSVPLYQSVDYCLRVGAAGRKIIWTPHSTLLYTGEAIGGVEHAVLEENVTGESESICRQWLPQLANDRCYNPNLALVRERYTVDAEFAQPQLKLEGDLPRVIGFGAGSYGSWQYRVVQPLDAMVRCRAANSRLLPFSNTVVRLPTTAELERLKPDAFLMHNTLHDGYIETLEKYRRINDAFIVFGQDDLLFALPPKNPFSRTVYKDAKKRIRKCLQIADRLVVTTEALADELKGMAADIRVVPNYMDDAVWGHLGSERGVSSKPRVGWAGASQHLGDLEVLADVVRETADEVDWIFFGMCPDFVRPYVKEIHHPVSFEKYPERLAALNLDLALAPLEHNRFNQSKSNLRILEYGILGWPVIASDIEPYRGAPVCRVPNQTRAWVGAIRERIHDPEQNQREGDRLGEWVRAHWMLEQRLNEWSSALSPGADADMSWASLDAAGLPRGAEASG